jgi:CheY-like chemotaxis protein
VPGFFLPRHAFEEPMPDPRRILSVVPDLFFATRIAATGEALGVTVIAAAPAAALATAREEHPDLIVLDLHAPGDPMGFVRALRAEPGLGGIPVVGFYSHVEEAVREAAIAAGVDPVMPRSQFTRRLPELLAGHPPAPAGA